MKFSKTLLAAVAGAATTAFAADAASDVLDLTQDTFKSVVDPEVSFADEQARKELADSSTLPDQNPIVSDSGGVLRSMVWSLPSSCTSARDGCHRSQVRRHPNRKGRLY